jgi:hypothetical protein
MNEHAGPACALSGLIVGIFAVVLHDPSSHPTAPKSPAREASSPIARSSPPEPTRPNAIAAPPVAPAPSPVTAPKAAPPSTPRPSKPKPEPAPAVAQAPEKPAKRRTPPASPRPSFAVVETGETLADVAARVYGSEDAAEALWKANRDQVARLDSPLDRGTLLRTP